MIICLFFLFCVRSFLSFFFVFRNVEYSCLVLIFSPYDDIHIHLTFYAADIVNVKPKKKIYDQNFYESYHIFAGQFFVLTVAER